MPMPSGLPIANTSSPTRILALSPHRNRRQRVVHLHLHDRKVGDPGGTSFPGSTVPSDSVTEIS